MKELLVKIDLGEEYEDGHVNLLFFKDGTYQFYYRTKSQDDQGRYGNWSIVEGHLSFSHTGYSWIRWQDNYGMSSALKDRVISEFNRAWLNSKFEEQVLVDDA